MQTPPLPLVNGSLLVDNSFLELWSTCAQATSLNRLHQRVPAGEKASINLGTLVHEIMEYRYKTCLSSPPTGEQENVMSSMIDKHFEEHPVEDLEHRNLNFAHELIRRYNSKYRHEPFNILLADNEIKDGLGNVVIAKGQPLVELSFALPLFTFKYHDGEYFPAEIPVLFCGRIDLPVSWDNDLIIIDHKTDSMFFGPQRFLEEQAHSNQYLGYCYAFEELTGLPVQGFCVNGLRTKEPPKTKPRNGTIDDWWNEGFVRNVEFLAIRPEWKQQWKQDAITAVESFFWHYERGHFPKNGMFIRSCSRYGGCAYKDVCFAPTIEKGQEILASNVFAQNTWTPLKG